MSAKILYEFVETQEGAVKSVRAAVDVLTKLVSKDQETHGAGVF